MNRFGWAAHALCAAFIITLPALAADAPVLTKNYALTLVDKPKYGPDFKHLDWVNPNAPKGGEVRLYAIGGFDSFNPFIIKGNPAAGIGRTFDTLMTSPDDDIMTEYGLIAESAEVAPDLSYVIYNLRPQARFHDGSPITADDVIFSFNILREKGQPIYRFYYANVKSVEKLGKRRVKFLFSGPPNRELPQIVGQIPIFSKAYWSTRDFSKSSLEPPLGSGPYKVKAFEPNRYVVYERVKDYWASDLPINRGTDNFGQIRYEYFRDGVVALEGFKAHQYDYRVENSSKNWATSYDFPARRRGLVKVAEMPNERPVGMQCFAFNIRREKFKDPKLREALAYAFDFEWSNKNLFYGQYKRTRSFFQNSDLAATGLPSPEELKLLNPWRGKIPDEVFTKAYEPPKTNGSGDIRGNLRKAMRILQSAGWKIVNNRLVDPRTGRPLEIEFLLYDPAFERVTTPFIRNLRRLGVIGHIRTVDPAQYQNRVRDFDFDVIVATFGESLSPGNEQRDYWTSSAAKRRGSSNVIGIANPAVDALVEKIVQAPDHRHLVFAARALDRVLQWNHYVIPQWYIASDRIAWWNRFGRPAKRPRYSVGFSSWWIDPAKDAAVKAGEAAGAR